MSSPRLPFKHGGCFIGSLKQQSKEIGLLSHKIASKSYRYCAYQQASLVAESHDLKVGRARAIMTRERRPLSQISSIDGRTDPEIATLEHLNTSWVLVRLVELLEEAPSRQEVSSKE